MDVKIDFVHIYAKNIENGLRNIRENRYYYAKRRMREVVRYAEKT